MGLTLKTCGDGTYIGHSLKDGAGKFRYSLYQPLLSFKQNYANQTETQAQCPASALQICLLCEGYPGRHKGAAHSKTIGDQSHCFGVLGSWSGVALALSGSSHFTLAQEPS